MRRGESFADFTRYVNNVMCKCKENIHTHVDGKHLQF